MSSVNKVILIGNVGRDPEIRTGGTGAQVAAFSIATTESWRDKATGERKDRTEWHNVVVFNEGLIKIVEHYVKKGSKLYIEGQVCSREYTDKEGTKRRVTEVVLQKFGGTLVLLTSQQRQAPEADSYGTTSTRQAASGSGPASAPIDDDIPF